MNKIKYYLKKRIKLLFLIIKFNIERDTAYIANNWGNIISTTAYTISALVFLNIVYANTKTIGGLDKNEMLLLIFINQLYFYLFFAVILKSIRKLTESVNSGELDFVFTKPLPGLFYVSIRELDTYNSIRDAVVPLAVVVFSINWQAFTLSPINTLASIIIFILGFLTTSALHFISALPAFWLGESTSITDLSLSLDFDLAKPIPLEGWRNFYPLNLAFISILPFLISSSITLNVFLGKMEPLIPLLLALLLFIIFSMLKHFLWYKAIRNYSSASS